MDMQEAFADRLRVGAGLGFEPGELARAVAFHRQDGMKGEAHVMTTLGQEADGRIDQERHVVIEDVDERHIAERLVRIGDGDLGCGRACAR